jgi:hypothetical protein
VRTPRSAIGALSFDGFEHNRAGAIAEQDAGRAVGPVENARERFGADDQNARASPDLM